MAEIRFSFDTGTDDAPYRAGAKQDTFARLRNYLKALVGGAVLGTRSVVVGTAPVAASGTYTVGSGATGTLTATINGVAVAITSVEDPGDDADALASAINGKVELSGVVTASSDGVDTVTVTSVVKGPVGNYLTTEASGTGLTADQTRLAGGAETTETFTF